MTAFTFGYRSWPFKYQCPFGYGSCSPKWLHSHLDIEVDHSNVSVHMEVHHSNDCIYIWIVNLTIQMRWLLRPSKCNFSIQIWNEGFGTNHPHTYVVVKRFLLVTGRMLYPVGETMGVALLLPLKGKHPLWNGQIIIRQLCTGICTSTSTADFCLLGKAPSQLFYSSGVPIHQNS